MPWATAVQAWRYLEELRITYANEETGCTVARIRSLPARPSLPCALGPAILADQSPLRDGEEFPA